MAKKKTKKEKQQKASVTIEIVEKINTLITAAFGLVAALAWNDTIKALFSIYFPKPEESITAQFLYALFITVIVVLITVYIARYLDNLKSLVGDDK